MKPSPDTPRRIRRIQFFTALILGSTSLLAAAPATLEKTALKLGFIKLTDCAPIVIAKEKGFFRDEGLSVEVVAQPNWKTLLDAVISGNLDGAHMLSGQPIAATIGIGTQAHVVTAFTMDLNGNSITVSTRATRDGPSSRSLATRPCSISTTPRPIRTPATASV